MNWDTTVKDARLLSTELRKIELDLYRLRNLIISVSATPSANAIPLSDGNGHLNDWIAQGANSGLDADTLRTFPPDTAANGDTIMLRNATGDTAVRYIYSTALYDGGTDSGAAITSIAGYTAASGVAGFISRFALKKVLQSRNGNAFPATPAAGDTWFRTDLGWLCFYDGTRWRTVHEYPAVRSGDMAVLAANGGFNIQPVRSDFAPYVTRIILRTNTAATNNGSNYWTILTRSGTGTYSAFTTLDSQTTAADTAATYIQKDRTPGSTQVPANYGAFDITATKTGTPGNLSVTAGVNYQLIVT